VFLLAAGAGPVAAGNWTITPRATVSETYSDNVGLAASGAERNDFITDANAGVSVHGAGRRLTLDADYNVQRVQHLRVSSANATNQQWQVGGEAEVLKKIGFLEFRTTMSQENTSNIGRTSDSNLNSGARNDVLTFQISPVVRHRFGRYADTEFRLTYDRVQNDNGTSSSSSNSWRGESRITSGSAFPRFPWTLAVNRRKTNNTNGTTSTFQTIDGRVSYVLTKRWTLDGGVGIDANDFATSGSDRQDGVRWRVGATFTPSLRTRVSGGYEHRPFDNSFFFDLSHRSRRTRWVASYSEEVTTSRQQQLQRVIVPLQDPFGQPIEDPVTGDPATVPLDFVVPTDETIVAKTFNATMAVTGRRTTATVSLARSDRSFQITNDTETQTHASVSVTRTLSRRLSLNGGLTWRLTTPRTGTGSGDETRWMLDAGLSYQVARRANGRLSYRYTKQEDEAGASDFSENQIAASVNLRF